MRAEREELMKMITQKHVKKVNTFFVLACLLVVICNYSASAADYPSWWTNRNVITNTVVTNDFAAANAGELKWIASKAKEELDERLSGIGGAGVSVASLVGAFTPSNNYLAVNAGQLKNVAAPFWERLIRIGYTNTYPWSTNSSAVNDYVMVNIGQVKNLFGFDLLRDADSDGMPDWWEMKYFGNLSQGPAGDYDRDGVVNILEYLGNTDPTKVDTASDGVSDGVKLAHGGIIVAWGWNDYGQLNIPPDLQSNDVVAISAGSGFSMALRAGGTVACWGDNSYGQTNVPVGLTNVMAISGGETSCIALRSNGTVACWGDNSYGQTNVPSSLTNIIAVSVGSSHAMALRDGGTVACWGDNSYGQTNVPVGLTNVMAISGGSFHNMALTSNGLIVCWGNNYFEQTNVPAGLSNVVAISAGYYHCMALKMDGTVVCWGYNGDGEVDIPAGLSNVVAISAGDFHSMALKVDGTVVCWGYNEMGQTKTPTNLNGVVLISAGGYHNLALVGRMDSDNDGMPDWWERRNGLNPYDSRDAALDADGDGLSNLDEFKMDANPRNASDGGALLEATRERIKDLWGMVMDGGSPVFANPPGSQADLEDLQRYLNSLSGKCYKANK